MDEIASLLGGLTLLIGVPVNLYAMLKMRNLSHEAPYLGVLKERYRTAIILLIYVLIFGLIFVNNDRPIPPLSVEATKIITRSLTLVLAIVPAVAWLRLYRSPKNKQGEEDA